MVSPEFPESKNLLFKPFSQIDSTLARRHGGTGLGLSICRQLVLLMNGDIWHEDKKDGGSCFSFTASFENPYYESDHHLLSGKKVGILLADTYDFESLACHVAHLEGLPNHLLCRKIAFPYCFQTWKTGDLLLIYPLLKWHISGLLNLAAA